MAMKRKWSWGRTTMAALGLGAFLMAFSAMALLAYTTFQYNSGTLQAPQPVAARWSSLPVAWLMNSSRPNNNVDTTGCSIDPSSCIQASLAAGFTTWTSATVPIQGQLQSLTNLSTTYSGTSTVQSPNVADCQNVIGFSDSASDFPTGAIAFTEVATVTSSQYTCSGGATKTCNLGDCIVDADIEFNPNENFSISLAPPANTFTIQSVATHEEGHLLGMNHSGIGHAVMFPFGDTTATGQTTALSTDDAIGISFLYPCTNPPGPSNCTAAFSTSTGEISGTVSLNSAGTFAAHVVAIDAATGNVVMDGLTRPDGSYTLYGVPPGQYNILALPLAPDTNSGILVLDDFSGWDCGFSDPACTSIPQNDTNYTGRYD
jgi:Matrixin